MAGVAVVEASEEGDVPGGVPLGVVVEETPGVGNAPLFRMSAIWLLYILPLMTFCWSQEASHSMNPPKFGSFFSFFIRRTILQNSYDFLWIIVIFLFYFICHIIITKNIGKEEKKWRGDLTETIGAYERLGLLELRAKAVSHQLKKRRRKVEDGKIYKLFSYLLNNLIFSFFLKEERD